MEEVEGDRRSGVELDDMGAKGGERDEGKGWKGPRVGWVKINVDAGVKEGISVGTGAICRDDMGKILWSLSHSRREVWEPHVAEAVAIMDRVEEALKAGHTMVEVESDCVEVIEALKKRKAGRSMFYFIIDDILRICTSFNSVVWSFTRRVNNVLAHELAHVLPAGTGKVVWSNRLPETLECLLDSI
ncbi:uncharacterized protein LOC141629026 [Silene latifolia]|uniref:uncharacterized protein LOC141629026 n=1 Tax=Silene latifolia TaxID=37657 RepID=UPI003D776E63